MQSILHSQTSLGTSSFRCRCHRHVKGHKKTASRRFGKRRNGILKEKDDEGMVDAAKGIDGLQLVTFPNRSYNPELGIWHNIDPLASKFPSISPYVYCLGNPVRLIDLLGLAPGDPYKTEEEAGVNAISDIDQKSVNQSQEAAGWIYKNADKTFSYTEPNWGTKSSSSPGSMPGDVAASYHTHGSDDPGYNNNEFSGQDIDVNANVWSTSAYLGTPEGSVKNFDVKNQTGISTIRFLPIYLQDQQDVLKPGK